MINWCSVAYKRNDTIPLVEISMIFLVSSFANEKKNEERKKSIDNKRKAHKNISSNSKSTFKKIAALWLFICGDFFSVIVAYCSDAHMDFSTYAIVSIVVIWRECLCTHSIFKTMASTKKKRNYSVPYCHITTIIIIIINTVNEAILCDF